MNHFSGPCSKTTSIMDRAPDNGSVNPSPRILRRRVPSEGSPPVPSTRNSIKAIEQKSIVQRRTQLFEQGKVEADIEADNDAEKGILAKETEAQQKDKPPWQSPEHLKKPQSPSLQKPAIVSPKPRKDIKSSPSHEARSPRPTSEPVPLVTRTRPQPRVIGAEPPSLESPSKPPRTKKPSARSRLPEGLSGPTAPPGKPVRPTKPARPDSMGDKGKNVAESSNDRPPKPTRPAPEVPATTANTMKEKPKRPLEKPDFIMMRNSLYSSLSEVDDLADARAEKKELSVSLSSDGAMPKYAVVDKTKKTRPKSNDESSSKGGSSQYYDGIILLPRPGDCGEDKADAPPKPPRTFAHDAYLKKKAEKRDKRRPCSDSNAKYDEVATNGDSEKADVVEPYGQDVPHRVRPYKQSRSYDPNFIEPYAQSPDFQSVSPDSQKPVCRSQSVDCPENQKLNESLYSEIPELDRNRKPAPPPRPRAPQRPPAPQMSKTCAQRNQSAVVKVVRHNAKVPEEGFIKSGRRKINNPSYERKHECIPIKTFVDQKTGALKRYKSDECLYADPQGNIETPTQGYKRISDDPVYQDPIDVLSPESKTYVTAHGVSLDDQGYAIPDTPRHTLGRQKHRSPSFNIKGAQRWGTLDHSRAKLAKLANQDLRATLSRKRIPSVRDKVSRAYSLLHKRPELSPEGQPVQLPSPEEDEDSQVDLAEHQKRLAHVSSIKEKQYATLEWVREPRSHLQPQLFDYTLVVGLEKVPEHNHYKPKIIFKFPDPLPAEINTIAEFCFPDAEVWRPVTQANTEDFSFVLTSSDGARQNGYCRRLLPPGSGNRLPEVFCVVSGLSAPGFFQQLHQEVDYKRRVSLDTACDLLKAAYSQPLPSPGREAWIRCPLEDGRKETVILKRSRDAKLEKMSFDSLFKHLSVDNILKIFGAILLERHIVFTAQHLSTLSSCISALTSLTFPFTWQHTYVPVLPDLMMDVSCAPTPYILGILSTSLPHLQTLELEEVLIVDLDNDNLITSIGDEAAIIPRKLQKCLREALAEDKDATGLSFDTIVFEAFLRMFVETTGHYTEFLNTQQDGQLVFQKEQFAKAVSSKSIRMFLEWFVETQMFEVFITDRLESAGGPSGLFEVRIEEYREEMEQMHISFKDNVKQIGRRMIHLVSEAGGRLRKALGGEKNVYV